MIIIAEAGVNHNGNLDMAHELIDAAVESGADIIKFQSFNTSSVVSKHAEKAAYQNQTTDANESQYEMIKKLELDREAHIELIKHCEKDGIKFLSSPFDHESIDLLNKLGLETFKIPSGEITNLPYLRHIGSYNKNIILSTGMSELDEVERAIKILVEAGTNKNNITILHCNTEYPTPMQDVNLNAMITIRNELNVKVGYSDHTLGIEIPIAAAAMGATIIEKHFTLDCKLEGPDHKASLEPDVFKAMVQAIQNVGKAMGDGVKKPSSSELKNMSIVRKSIVAKNNINEGDCFTSNNLAIKRPGTGITPMKWDQIINSVSKKSYAVDELIDSIELQ
jgi:N,N'-diacetyllegionaminate synthase